MSFLADLEQLGDQLISAELPADPRKILGALVHYIEHGSLQPPQRLAPDTVRQVHEEASEIARLQDRVRQLEGDAKGEGPVPAPGQRSWNTRVQPPNPPVPSTESSPETVGG